ncbi:MAG: Gfo/Idh/MocA family oxidoreductase [Candidatus Anammoximicrobium sp.]|nr:Gfo/Idh/MocA family oxidoreductase [Candidatus Anammoximicrobium sp.]
MADRTLGIALHGAGWVAHAHAASWLKNPHAKIVSVSDVDRQRAQRFAEEFQLDCAVRDDFQQVLDDRQVEVVDITGPSHVHAPQGIAAAQAGKHLLVEKPMGLTLAENQALRDAVDRAGVKSLAGFVLRWNPAVETIKSLVASGTLGQLFYVEVDYWHRMKPAHHAWDLHSRKQTGGSAMLLGGCHAVDMLRWLTGDEAVEASAVSNNQRGLFEYAANVVALIRFRSGIIAKTSTLFDCEMPYAFNIDVAGTEGTVRDNRLWSKRLLPGQTGWMTIPTILPDSGDVQHHPFDAEINHLVDCILQDRPSHCNVADAYRSHELCLAIDRSLEEGGRPVTLPLA